MEPIELEPDATLTAVEARAEPRAGGQVTADEVEDVALRLGRGPEGVAVDGVPAVRDEADGFQFLAAAARDGRADAR